MGFCSFCGSELNESDDGPEFLHSLRPNGQLGMVEHNRMQLLSRLHFAYPYRNSCQRLVNP
jgi:hypothetical protein